MKVTFMGRIERPPQKANLRLGEDRNSRSALSQTPHGNIGQGRTWPVPRTTYL